MMAKKIVVTHFRNVHYHAGCNDCGFTAGICTDETPKSYDVRKAVRGHVAKTGHHAWIEQGTHINYDLVHSGETSI
jgi:heterodisulfide reductase subunit C